MKKLLVDFRDAPVDAVTSILQSWTIFANLLEKRSNIPPDHFFLWNLQFQIVEGLWTAVGSISLAATAQLGKIFDQVQFVDIPVTMVEEITIATNGQIRWSTCSDTNPRSTEISPELVDNLATALTCGNLVHRDFRLNLFEPSHGTATC